MRTTLFVALLLSTIIGNAQNYPFPQDVKYKYGTMSAKISHADVQKEYDNWKTNYVRTCGATEMRVIDIDAKGQEFTVSEGIGYGLAIAAYVGDKMMFDRLLNYFMARRNFRGMMNWQYFGCETGDNKKDGAADGDLDAAMGMLIATKQWPKEKRYETLTSAFLDSVQKHYFVECGGILVLKPGDGFGGCGCTNPSYFSPAYYRAFARFKSDQGNKQAALFWEKAADDSYIPLLKNADKNTGLVYAWTNADGTTPTECNYQVSGAGAYNTYQYDACRVPWRIAMDYLWWGNKKAADWLQKINRFVKTPVWVQHGADSSRWYGAGGIKNVIDGYQMNGLRNLNVDGGQWHSVPFVGGFALASMAANQSDVDECMAEFSGMLGGFYFDSCLGVLYKLLATGNYWNPYDMHKQ